MNTISGLHSTPSAAAQRPESAAPTQQSTAAAEQAGRQKLPDKTAPSEPAARFEHEPVESPGRYWVEPGQDGPAVRFEPPENPESLKEAEPLPADQASAQDKDQPSLTMCSTDKVDQEIENLRNRVAELKQQIGRAQNEAEKADLQRELDASSRELAQKDNDAYRRQHAQFTNLG